MPLMFKTYECDSCDSVLYTSSRVKEGYRCACGRGGTLVEVFNLDWYGNQYAELPRKNMSIESKVKVSH